jgi:hypothetical protein
MKRDDCEFFCAFLLSIPKNGFFGSTVQMTEDLPSVFMNDCQVMVTVRFGLLPTSILPPLPGGKGGAKTPARQSLSA